MDKYAIMSKKSGKLLKPDKTDTESTVWAKTFLTEDAAEIWRASLDNPQEYEIVIIG